MAFSSRGKRPFPNPHRPPPPNNPFHWPEVESRIEGSSSPEAPTNDNKSIRALYIGSFDRKENPFLGQANNARVKVHELRQSPCSYPEQIARQAQVEAQGPRQ